MKVLFSNVTSVFALLVFPLVGCGDDSSGGPGGTGGSGGIGGTGGTEPSTFTNTGTVNEFNPVSGATPTPISGVTLCVIDTDNCATTDENGQYTLDLPRNVESAVTVVREGYFSVIVPFDSDAIGDTTTTGVMATNTLAQTFFDLLMTPFPPTTTGITSIVASEEGAGPGGANAPLAGVTYELITGSGLPYFADDNSLPSGSLTETQAPGLEAFMKCPREPSRFGGVAPPPTARAPLHGMDQRRIRISGSDDFAIDWISDMPDTRFDSRDNTAKATSGSGDVSISPA